jgi:predicted dinucleotide-binding enzyme
VLVCSDHPDAMAATSELIRRIPDLRPFDAGSLAAAGPVEAFTAVLLSLNSRYKGRATIHLTGIDADTRRA